MQDRYAGMEKSLLSLEITLKNEIFNFVRQLVIYKIGVIIKWK